MVAVSAELRLLVSGLPYPEHLLCLPLADAVQSSLDNAPLEYKHLSSLAKLW